jgi:hypothetical protein
MGAATVRADRERLTDLERREREARWAEFHSDTRDNRSHAREAEQTAYRAGMGDDADD